MEQNRGSGWRRHHILERKICRTALRCKHHLTGKVMNSHLNRRKQNWWHPVPHEPIYGVGLAHGRLIAFACAAGSALAAPTFWTEIAFLLGGVLLLGFLDRGSVLGHLKGRGHPSMIG